MSANSTNFRVAAVGVSTLVLGLLGGGVATAAKIFASPMKGVITITKVEGPPVVYNCQQNVNGYKDAFPHLGRPFWGIGGNTIAWTGINVNGQATTNVDVVFPNGGSPFTQPDFHNGGDSGTVVSGAPPKDYPFDSVKVDGITCSTFIDPGVHANQ
jgi:hypothetical protein